MREFIYPTGRKICRICKMEFRPRVAQPLQADSLMPCGHSCFMMELERKSVEVSPVEFEALNLGRISTSDLQTFRRVLDRLNETERDILSFPPGVYRFKDGSRAE